MSRRSRPQGLQAKWAKLTLGRKVFLIAYGAIVLTALNAIFDRSVVSSDAKANLPPPAPEVAKGGPEHHFVRYKPSVERSLDAGVGLPAWRRYAAGAPASLGRPIIAVVIDDMGPNQKNARRAMTMPAPLTLSFLPYANDLTPMVTRARANGHEVLLHLPMEPINGKLHSPGPNSLLTGLDDQEIGRRLTWNLERFKGYVGVNNHMGSRFTADPSAMAPVMAELKARGLLFLDSRTTPRSVGRRLALQSGVPLGRRDVFLDNERSATEVAAQLREVEDMARRNGSAIAIGHPHDETLDVLENWIGDLERRGFVLAPISTVIARGYQIAARRN
jgi:uncharacterized protein